jgi:hypothetical protein
MAHQRAFKDDEEKQIARGGKGTAIWIMSLTLFVVAGGVALTMLIRQEVVSPPARPGTTEGKTPAGEVKPPSP